MKISVILAMVALACLLSRHATAQTKDGTVSSRAQKSVHEYVRFANKEALAIYLGIIRASRSEGFVYLKESYPFITCMGDLTLIQFAALNRQNRFIASSDE